MYVYIYINENMRVTIANFRIRDGWLCDTALTRRASQLYKYKSRRSRTISRYDVASTYVLRENSSIVQERGKAFKKSLKKRH